jgi:hypothetical protein
MKDDFKISTQGMPRWFSPKHAGEKFKEICLQLAILATDAENAKRKGLAKKLLKIQELAERQARHYLLKSPVESVRIMQPSGAIYVTLAGGREIVVPQE